MARENPISINVYKRHIRLYRYLNDTWIFTTLIRPMLDERVTKFENNTPKGKRYYTVPKERSHVLSRRTNQDVAQIFRSQYQKGIFESNIISIISKIEAFIQDCMIITILNIPEKISIISEKGGIPFELFLKHDDKNDILRSYVTVLCSNLLFSKPNEYMDKFCKLLSISLDIDIINQYIESKASRDIIIHNTGKINKLYIEKSGKYSRGEEGDELIIDLKYFKKTVILAKKLSGSIQAKVEAKYG